MQGRYIPDTYDLVHVAGGSYILRDRRHVSWLGSVLPGTDPAQHLRTAGWHQGDLDRGLSDLSSI